MKDIDFKPILGEILPTVNNIKFSTMYFGRHCHRNIIITAHQSKTVLIALKDNHEWNVDFHTVISSRGKSIKAIHKIDGNDSLVLLLDEERNLWKLINAFEFSNEKDECLYLIDEKCFYEWVPYRKFNGYKVLEYTALSNGFTFILETSKKSYILQFHSSDNLTFADDYAIDELKTTSSNSFQMNRINLNRESDDGALIITCNGSTYVCTKSKVVSLINVSNLNLISVFIFEKVNCLVLCYETGKFLFLVMNEKFKLMRECAIYVFNKVVCVEICTCSNFCLIWSDGMNLHHTKVEFQFEKPADFVKLRHLKVTRKIMNVKYLCKLHNGLLAVTMNSFYYQIFENKFKEAVECVQSSDDVLSEIFSSGLLLNTLNEDITLSTDYLKFVEMIQRQTYKDSISIKREQNHIVIRTNLKCTLKKKYWRIRQEAYFNNKYYVELTNLQMDLCEGMMVKVESGIINMEEIEVSLIGEFGPDFCPLFMFLGSIKVDKNIEHEEMLKNIEGILKRRNDG